MSPILKREIMITSDGSNSLFVPELNEHYHSYHGAINESKRIFIELGLEYACRDKSNIRILEVGMGTGLNVLMTIINNESLHKTIEYDAVEAYPLDNELVNALNYTKIINHPNGEKYFKHIHAAPWNETEKLSDSFSLTKIEAEIENIEFSDEQYDLVYFDAFAPEVQAELWTEEIFEKMHRLLKPDGILVTYCVKGVVKRNLMKVGFEVQKHKGPVNGKREVLRGVKIMK